jgi:hypothetical protein
MDVRLSKTNQELKYVLAYFFRVKVVVFMHQQDNYKWLHNTL